MFQPSISWTGLMGRVAVSIWSSTHLLIHLIALLISITVLDGWKPLIVSLVAACVLSAVCQYFSINQSNPIRPSDCIVITGTSSGIGRAAVTDLLKTGYNVIATVRRSSDVDGLMHEAGPLSSRLTVFSGCDLTIDQDVESTYQSINQLIEKRSWRLAGLVCNAGAAYAVPIELASRRDIDNQFELTVFGTMNLINRFRPLIELHGSTLVVISSIVAHFPVPGMGLYSASKAALNACIDELRREWNMINQSIKVIIIEPGQASTKFGSHVTNTSTTAAQSELYRESAGRFMHLLFPSDPPHHTVRSINLALQTKSPPAYMRAGYTSLPTGLSVMLPYVIQDYTLGFAYRWPFVR